MPKRISTIALFTATRKATEQQKKFVWDKLDYHLHRHGLLDSTFVIHGDADGGDQLAEDYCLDLELSRSRIPYFSQFGSFGGAARNLAMIWHAFGLKICNPDAQIICIAFPLVGQKGGGTRNMMKQCRDFKIPVHQYPIRIEAQ